MSADGRTAYATVVPATALGDLSVEQAEAILDAAAEPAQGSDVQVEAGGQLGDKITEPATEISELIGICAAMLILVLVFGTITAMALPIAVAIMGLACGLSIVSLLGHVLSVSDVAPTLATMIGLGVGIDYSLFIVTRARSARHDGMSVHDAIGHAAATSGSAVAFAGGTVVVALLALAVSGLSMITVLGQAAAIVVVVAVLASMTLLPALLALCGDRIERLRVGRDKRPTLGHSTLWQRWGQRLARRPGLFAVTSVVLLLTVSAPVSKLGLGLTDQSSSPSSTTVRQAYDLLTDGFGPGVNGPLLVMADLGSEKATGPDDPRLAKLHDGLGGRHGRAGRRGAAGLQGRHRRDDQRDPAGLADVRRHERPRQRGARRDHPGDGRERERRRVHGPAARPRRPDRRAAAADHRRRRGAEHGAAADRVPLA